MSYLLFARKCEDQHIFNENQGWFADKSVQTILAFQRSLELLQDWFMYSVHIGSLR